MNAKATTKKPALKTALKKKKKGSFKINKKTRKKLIIGGVVLFLGYAVYWLFAPAQGGITYGACKVFLQLHVRYPAYLRLSKVTDFGDSVRIWFTQIDSFGQYRMEMIQCHFRYPTEEEAIKYGNVSFVLDKVAISRREVDPEKIDRFNRSMASIIANPPNLTLPYEIPDSLQDIQIDTDSFRKKIFD